MFPLTNVMTWALGTLVQLHQSLSLVLPHVYRSLDVNNYGFTYASDGVSLDLI
jgi:hypothetical protein